MKRSLALFVGLLMSIWAFAQSYITNGTAVAVGGDCYRITNTQQYQLGTVWYSDPLDLSQPFDLRFQMNYGASDANGADGMVWVLQTVGVNALGSAGSGMGFGGFAQSFGIEFDTYSNNAVSDPASNLSDPEFDHIAFLRNGNVNHQSINNLAGPVQLSATSANVEDGQNHDVRVVWDPATQLIQTYFDCELRLQANIALGSFFGIAPVYWGFTGSTGGLTNVQSACLSPDILVNESEVDICLGESVVLGADLQGTNFSWSPSTSLSATDVATPTANPSETQVYTVNYLDLCDFPQQAQVTVNVNPLPSANAGEDEGICEGGVASLTGVGSSGSYLWTTANGAIVSSAAILSPTVASPGDYVFNVTSQAGCTSSDVVTVFPIPLPPLDLGDDVEVCEGEVLSLEVSEEWQSVLWSTGASNFSIEVESSGTISVEVTYESCSSSDAVTVTVVDLPTLNLGPDREICENEALELNAGIVCLWNNGESAESIEVLQSGTYWCEFQSSDCIVRDSVYVEVFEYPQFDLPSEIQVCEGETATIESAIAVTWDNGDFSTEYLVNGQQVVTATAVNGACVNSQSVQIDYIYPPSLDVVESIVLCPGETVDFTIGVGATDAVLWEDGSTSETISIGGEGEFSVTVSNICGVAADTLVAIVEECEPHVFIPSAFTPDYDGVNDVWRVETMDIVWFNSRVFNRWGDLIWSSTDPEKVWTGDVRSGTHFGQVEVYTYVVDYISKFSPEVITRRGFITLLR